MKVIATNALIQSIKNQTLNIRRLKCLFKNMRKEVLKVKMINYMEEVRRLDSFVPGDASNYWKPKPGQYKVKALTELEEAQPFIAEGKEPKEQAKIDLLLGKDTVTWTIAKGISPASAYGQLCSLASKLGGTLINKDFMIVVTNDKKKNTYTIVQL